MTAAMRVVGADKLRAALRRVGDDLTDGKEVHLAIAQVVTRAAQPPRGESGRTAASLRPGATKRASIVRAGRASAPYVPRDHYGDPPGGPIKANPWLSEAAQQTEPTWFALYTKYVERSISKIRGATQ